jgi:hypothetical protein
MRHELTEKQLSLYDMVIFPGGRGNANAFQSILKSKKPILHSYLERGGTYLGICMGAYWADSAYFDLLAETRCIQYISRPKAEIRRSFPTLVRADWQGQSQRFYFFDGCAFIGSDPSVETFATYANGDPMAVMKGNIGLIGCHLESELNWYQSKTMKPAWHKYYHHRLLNEFIGNLLSRGKLYKLLDDNSKAHLDVVETIDTEQEIIWLRSALQEIEYETSIFSRGALKKIHDIAYQALKQTSSRRLKRV